MEKNGSIKIFRRNFFCLKVPKKSVGGESFSFSLLSGIAKVWIREGGGEYQDFPSKIIICLTVPKNFVEEPFGFSPIASTENVCVTEGGVSRFSVGNILSHSAENFRKGTLSCFTNFAYRKMLRINSKVFWKGNNSEPDPTAWKHCCPSPTAVFYL